MKKQSDELSAKIGDTLQLQLYPGNENTRYYVRLIGYLPGKSIIVGMPREDGNIVKVRENQFVIVRLLSGNEAQGFTASVLKVSHTPYGYLHLSYPDKLKSIVVRKAQRVAINIICSVQNEEEGKAFDDPKSAAIKDLSTAGALLMASAPLGDLGDHLTIATRIKVSNIEQYLNITAILRRCEGEPENEPTKFNHGLEFIELDDQSKLAIHGFVYELIANQQF